MHGTLRANPTQIAAPPTHPKLRAARAMSPPRTQEKRLSSEVASLERDTGIKLRVLAQNYPETPGVCKRGAQPMLNPEHVLL